VEGAQVLKTVTRDSEIADPGGLAGQRSAIGSGAIALCASCNCGALPGVTSCFRHATRQEGESEKKVPVNWETGEQESTPASPGHLEGRRQGKKEGRYRKMYRRCGYTAQRVGEASHPGSRPGAVAWCWHGDCCPWHRQGKCLFRHAQETGVRPCHPDTVEQEEEQVPALLMESLVTIQQELAALKKEVTELRRISDLQKEKRRAKRARQKERKTQKEDPHSEEGQDKAESAHTNAEGAGVVMSEENRPAHAECAGCDGECFGDRVSGKGTVGESQEEDSEACSGEGSEDSSLYAFSTWSREAERLPPLTPPVTPEKKKSRARSRRKRATARDADSGSSGYGDFFGVKAEEAAAITAELLRTS